MNNNKSFVVVVCGPTASGKTKLAVDLALAFDGEIISADSMQIYKYMNIATAKPDESEKQGIKHHLMDFLEPYESFSVADYVALSHTVIADIISRSKLPIIVGGTGLYIDSLLNNIQFDETGADYQYRDELKLLAAKNGNKVLHDMLREIDTETANKLHENNLSRIIRALEVYKLSGKKLSELEAQSRSKPSPYKPLFFGINYESRDDLYERINRRVDIMLESGLIEEARWFYSMGDLPTSAQAIGYKELKPYLDGKATLNECTERLKQETRNYAKRQLTWFRKNKDINWLMFENNAEKAEYTQFYENEYIKILNTAKKMIRSSCNCF